MLFQLSHNHPKSYSNTTTRQYPGDAGLDLFVTEETVIPPRSSVLVPLGVKCQLRSVNPCVWQWITNKTIYKYHSYFLMSRSSIYKTPLVLQNGVGLIDSSYRGELKAPMYNLSDHPYTVQVNQKLVQIVMPDARNIKYTCVDSAKLTNTVRGERGFGSTGT